MVSGKSMIEERRSVSFFDPERDIPHSTLRSIIDLAVAAPSAFNLQPWRIVAVRSSEGKQRLFPQANKQPRILEAPVTLIIIGDRSGYEANRRAWREHAELLASEERLKKTQKVAKVLYGSTEERRIKFAESNAGLLAMSIMYAAKCYDVDSHPMSGIDFAGIKSEFALSEDEDAVMLISLGYFNEAQRLEPRRRRFGYPEIVHEV